MEQASFGTLNYAVLVAYFLLVIALALMFSGRQQDTESYFLAGRRMPWLAVSLSMVASMLSALSYLGSPAAAYEDNASLILASPAMLLATPLVIVLFFPIYKRLNVTMPSIARSDTHPAPPTWSGRWGQPGSTSYSTIVGFSAKLGYWALEYRPVEISVKVRMSSSG